MARSRELYQISPTPRGPRDPVGDVFDVQVDHAWGSNSIRIRIRSRRYDVDLSYELAYTYLAHVDPRHIVQRAHQIIGNTLRSWHEAGIAGGAGRDMAQALVPHWQRLIQHEMESLEYHSRRWAEVVYWGTPMHGGAWYEQWASPTEDPKAKEKARQLLMRNLDDGQLKSFKKEGWFYVTGGDGVRYKISTARSFNVEAADGTAYCGQLTDTPVEDQMLAQKLLLQENPQEFIAKSNKRPPLTAGAGIYGDVFDINTLRRAADILARP